MEDKVKIVRELEILLKSTREFSDLDHLEYTETDKGEFVLVYFRHSYNEPFTLHPELLEDRPRHDYWINVTADSGIALIKDVIRRMCK